MKPELPRRVAFGKAKSPYGISPYMSAQMCPIILGALKKPTPEMRRIECCGIVSRYARCGVEEIVCIEGVGLRLEISSSIQNLWGEKQVPASASCHHVFPGGSAQQLKSHFPILIAIQFVPFGHTRPVRRRALPGGLSSPQKTAFITQLPPPTLDIDNASSTTEAIVGYTGEFLCR